MDNEEKWGADNQQPRMFLTPRILCHVGWVRDNSGIDSIDKPAFKVGKGVYEEHTEICLSFSCPLDNHQWYISGRQFRARPGISQTVKAVEMIRCTQTIQEQTWYLTSNEDSAYHKHIFCRTTHLWTLLAVVSVSDSKTVAFAWYQRHEMRANERNSFAHRRSIARTRGLAVEVTT